jgi:predicted dehydrogenase
MSYKYLEEFGRPLRWGMVGGGVDSVIGETHRLAARVDARYQLVAGCFAVDPILALESAKRCLVPEERCYCDFKQMAQQEARRADGVEMVTICTPPHLHQEASIAFLEAGINVLCEKPLTRDLGEALNLQTTVTSARCAFAVTHCYTGYPMVREAKALIAAGTIGKIRQVECDFVSGPFLNEEPDRNKRHWRFVPKYMGRASILGEIGVHAVNMIHFVTGEMPEALLANMTTLTDGREVFDDAQILLEFSGNRPGRMWLSFVAAGNEHGLSFRVHGDQGSLKWEQERPEQLIFTRRGEYSRVVTPGHRDRLSPLAIHSSRLAIGHPEGYILAFANIYRDFADQILASKLDQTPDPNSLTVPDIQAGVATMRFLDAAVRSFEGGRMWQRLD